MKIKSNTIIKTAFLIYALIMFWLLFRQRMGREYLGTYWEVLNSNINLTPFGTIRLFIRAILGSDYEYTVRHSIINLAGNIIMFIPLGFFVPSVFPKHSTFFRCIAFCSIIILAVELIQLFTLLGSCDIDDYILNMAGIAMGYGIYKGCRLYGKIR